MSSLRNAVSRRPHKERSQPTSREKWGLLEKHKDYSLRAQDYNLKKKKLSQLSQKAKERNPDEFAFGMISQGRAGLGKHKSKQSGDDDNDSAGSKKPREGVPLSHDAVKLLKTQDIGYLRTVAAKGRREIERLTQEVGMDSVTLGKSRTGTKETFEDDQGEKAARGKKRALNGEVLQDQSQEEAETDQPMQRTKMTTTTTLIQVIEDKDDPPKPKSKKAIRAEQDALSRLRVERKRRKRLQDMRVAKLEALKTRQREVLAAADQLELQRAKMARTVGGVNKNGIRFKIRERKK
ncbi:uncharacterized protein A1O5_08451 [Cladophialophora psammophila CBS 110553]|uniref:Uncharacterized protein n=1 Tax=Cladophialophora psammophila CBS 110553 TaxID=1182543 RepID=W9WKG9_9EURO|nr:uncharacterized protein A1O5_08451 [Cladophialophora psammophila CBS 110553]EXJ68657.1 hypothetical protein A1O5_08451 [Cladophialophora psammophila CBS 110553]